MVDIRVGTAGWSIPPQHAADYGGEGSHLQRYARHFGAVEINTSFYRPHRPATYARWAASVPEGFRFSVKLPRAITHEARLHGAGAMLAAFLGAVQALGDRLGPVLIQLPPSLAFDPAVVRGFLSTLRDGFTGQAVCEPRHVSWFTATAEALLAEFAIGRVAADPAVVPAAGQLGGWSGLAYYRLHGAPEIYYSPYPAPFLASLAERLQAGAARRETWCIFDNTARGAAISDAATTLCLASA